MRSDADHNRQGESTRRERGRRRERQPPKPLDAARLEELALAYVARFATSAAKLEAYLRRKLRERGWAEEREADPRALVERYVGLGYVDDAAFARARSGGLLRRGYGQRRIDQTLGAAGISSDIREETRASEAEARHAALAMARKRRFGPFGHEAPDRQRREKQLAAMLRAGHALDSARELVDARDVEQAEEWACELDDDTGERA